MSPSLVPVVFSPVEFPLRGMEEQQTGQIVDIGANQFPKSAQNENDAERLATFKASQSFIRVYFGEFHLICIAHVQTQLLLWRATAWQLHELLGFTREAQLPYFTAVPDSQISGELQQLVDEIVNFGFIPNDQQIREIKNAITGVLKAETSAVLLERVIALGPLLADGWRRLLDAARAKSGRYKEKQVILLVLDSLRNQVTGEPEIDLKQRVAEMMEKYEAAEHDIDSIFQNPRLNISSTRSWFLFCPNHASAPVQLPGLQIDHASDFVELKWIRTELDETFLRSASTMAGRYRQNPEPFSTHDRLAFHTAYYLLSQGQNEFDRYESRFLGTVGFREQHHQTYLSLTDPGQGHVFGTTTKNSWMSGVTVHVEHLERPARSGMDAIESYRMPSVLEFARVRLHAGSAAPTTAFVGRPLRDSTEFKWDFIKVVDTVSSACSSMFNLGAAECKIGMSRLNASEMIAYMRALRGHTLKNHRQYLSAAFNLNTPLIDDIENKYLQKRMDIGVRAIELAALGGFEKVTWDGASDTYPSVPMLQATPNDKGQLSYAQAITLVHLAHSVGLTTYFSAGFKVAHIPATVYSGVDGVGIGGAQVIRAMDRTTGMHGEYQESRIEKLIDERDKAAKSPRGRGAKLLARLDQMFFEGSINTHELKLRKNLFSSLTADMIDEQKLQAMLDDPAVQATWEIDSSKAHDGLVSQERGDGERPWKGRALRLIHQRYDLQPLLRRHGGERSVDGDEQSAEVPGHEWNQFIASLQHTIEGDGDLHSLYMSKPWKTMRHNYQAWVRHMYKDLPKYFMGEIEASLKITPYGDRSWNQVNNVV